MAQRVEHHPLEAAFAALLANGLDGAGEALRILVNEASKIERAQFLNAQPHERSSGRTDYANGFKPKTVMTRVGELTFDVPQTRGGGFYPSALEKGSRTEQALNIALAEMYVQGVSTRKVITVLQSLLGPEVSISSTQVSRAAEQLDAGLAAWRERPLDETPYVFLDARYERVREGGRLIDCAVLVAVGVTSDGQRRVLGVSVALSEAEVHWRAFLDSLIRRGLKGVKLIISDDHAGLKAARRAALPSVPWQRCQFHLQQNAQAYVTRLDQRKSVHSASGRSSTPPIGPRPNACSSRRSRLGKPRRQSSRCGRKTICRKALPSSIFLMRTAYVYAPPMASNGSTGRSNGAPVWRLSFQTPHPVCASSPLSSRNATKNG